MHQDQGAQVDDVPVVDDAVDESDDASAEAPPIEGREVDAPADALAAFPARTPAQAQAKGRRDAGRGGGGGGGGGGWQQSGPGKLRSPTERW